MFTRNCIAILAFGFLVVPINADEIPNYKPIDAETIANYEQFGAKYIGFEVAPFGCLEVPPEPMTTRVLPGFRFNKLPTGILPRLPLINVPFGFDLSFSGVTDMGLKELKELKNLTAIDLGGTGVTDEGLKERSCLP